jgi:hypothetical protein
MELRRIEYSQNLYDPPALGAVITYDKEAQTNNAVKIEEFVEDSEKAIAVDQAESLCPGLDVEWWDKHFYIRDFAL